MGLSKTKLVIGITISGSVPLIRGQAKYFVDNGFDVYLMCPRDSKSITYCKEEGCTLIPIKIERYISPLKDLKTVAQIYSKLRKLQPDIINVGTPKMGLLGIIGAWLAGVNLRIYTCRGLRYEHEKGRSRQLLYITEKITGKLSNKIICISPSVKSKALEDHIFKEEKITVIGKGSSNGINLKNFNINKVSASSQKLLKEKLELQNKFVFGFVGRLIDRKGINELIDAFIQVHKTNPSTRLVLVGKKDLSQLYNPDIISTIENYPAIIWVGWQDNIPLFMSIFDVFVMPAWWEGFGNTYVEAAAMGKPVIGTDGTGCQDAFRHNYNGISVPIKTTTELKDAMLAYITNPSLVKEHGDNGIKWVKNFTPENIWKGQKNIYTQINT